MSLTRKATIVPLMPVAWDLESAARIPVFEERGLFVENVQGLLTAKHLELWREYLSDNQRKFTTRIRIGLVHRFESSGHVGREEEASKTLVEGAAACLQILRPTRSRSQLIQLRFSEDSSVDVFRFTHPRENPPNVPQSDIVNTIRPIDIGKLRVVLPMFLNLPKDGPGNVFRAVKNFLLAYSEIDEPFAQVLVWMAGIESMLWTQTGDQVADRRKKLLETIDPTWNVYEDSATEEFTRVEVKIGDIVDDLFDFRNRLVHGGWVPEEWQRRKGRQAVSGVVEYSEMLREASAAILRKLIVDWLDQQTT